MNTLKQLEQESEDQMKKFEQKYKLRDNERQEFNTLLCSKVVSELLQKKGKLPRAKEQSMGKFCGKKIITTKILDKLIKKQND